MHRKPVLILIFAALTFLMIAPTTEHAQVASTTIAVGVNATLNASADQYLQIPTCSRAAGCVAALELCNKLSSGLADSSHCITIASQGGPPWSTNLWTGIVETTTTAGGTSAIPYPFGTVNISVPANEVKQTP
jgi:hypothetical protein